MSKLYIFGIGGTGSRVIRSLTMLLAAGVDCGVDTIVPIIIDRDEANGDYSRTKLLIDKYTKVNEIALNTDKNRFFRTKIKLLNNQLLLRLNDNTEKFEDFIGKDIMTDENIANRALVDMLFSSETQALDMTAGFQGNPNIGSVVLNQFDNNDIFKAFAADFQKGDKIFIISSIFGGTGASGFPLLRKMLHTQNVKDADGNDLQNWGYVNEAPIGAISVMPYFTVNVLSQDSLVDSDTFIDKTRAALSYYKSEDKKLDTLYYIADKRTTNYDHHKGGDAQKNNAHFVELASALSILDFIDPLKAKENFNRNIDNKIVTTVYKEFGIKEDILQIKFNNLENDTKKTVVNPLSRFLLFRNYMTYVFDKKTKYQPYAYKVFTDDFIKRERINNLLEIQKDFHSWLQEMENQTRAFTPFNLDSTKAFDFIKGNIDIYNAKSFTYKNWAKVDHTLNSQIDEIDKALKEEECFLELFYGATEKLINY